MLYALALQLVAALLPREGRDARQPQHRGPPLTALALRLAPECGGPLGGALHTWPLHNRPRRHRDDAQVRG